MTRDGGHASAAFPGIQLNRIDTASSSLSVVGFYVCAEARNLLKPFDRGDQGLSGAGMPPTTAVLRKNWGVSLLGRWSSASDSHRSLFSSPTDARSARS